MENVVQERGNPDPGGAGPAPRWRAPVVPGELAPYLIVEIYDADPSRYFLETTDRNFSAQGAAQVNAYAPYLHLIQEEAQRRAFRSAHLLDSTVLGMNAHTDVAYLAVYQEKISAYQAWVEEQNEKAKIENWGFEEWARLIFSICTLVVSAINTIYGDKYTGVMGMILAIDQIQSMFTQRSMFSVVIGAIAIPIAEAGGWITFENEEQRQSAYERFNVWTPFTYSQDATTRALNSLWSTFFTLMLIYGPAIFKGIGSLIKSGFSKLGNWVDGKLGGSDYSSLSPSTPSQSLISPEKMLTSIKGKSFKGQLSTRNEADMAFLKQRFPQQWAQASALSSNPLLSSEEILNSFLRSIGLRSTFYTVGSYFYRAVYIIKQVTGGLISPTEWVELFFYVGLVGDSQWVDFSFGSYLGINNRIGHFLADFAWNWGDNFYFIWLQQETTVGLFKWLGYVVQGDYIGATIWDFD